MSAAAIGLLVRATILLLLVWGGARAVAGGGGSAAMRHAVWLLGFAGLAALPLLAGLLPALPVFVLPAVTETAASASAPAGAIAASPSVDLLPLFLAFYGAVVAALIGRQWIGRRLVERLWRESDPVPAADLRAELERLQASLGIGRRVEIRIARRELVPMTWGSARPRILLPPAALHWASARRRAVLLHELGHVARLDGASRLAADAVCALYWAHPGVWFAARQLRLAQEQACDDLVLSREADGATYARVLLDSAGAIARPGAALAMVSKSDLERRLRAILADVPRRRAGAPFVAVAASLTLGVTALAAAVAPAAKAISAPAAPITRPPEPAMIAATARPAMAASRPPATRASAALATAAAPPAIAAAPAVAAHPLDAQYRQRLADYQVALGHYRLRLGEFEQAKQRYRRQLAGQPAGAALAPVPPLAPVAPPAPLIPTVPPAPVIPPVPPGQPGHI